jgi:hypothetical protein
MTEPVSKWDEVIPNYEAGVVWLAKLDERFLCEVVRTGEFREGRLCVFDNDWGLKCIFEEKVDLSYDAQFGPDVADTALWEDMVLEYVDNKMNS